MLAELVDHVIGVDPDKDWITTAIIDAKTTGVVDTARFEANSAGYLDAITWAEQHTTPGERRPSHHRRGERDTDPAPVTTIAWRLWHLAIDFFDDYARRFGGDPTEAPATWTLNAEEAVDILREKWSSYRTVIAERDRWDQLAPNWEYWSQYSVADMAMHASNELVHHVAEIALLRDPYRASSPSLT